MRRTRKGTETMSHKQEISFDEWLHLLSRLAADERTESPSSLFNADEMRALYDAGCTPEEALAAVTFV